MAATPPQTLSARLASGEVLEVHGVRPSDTISDVRTRVAKDLKLDASRVKLIRGTSLLDDQITADELQTAEISIVLEPWPPSWYPCGKYRFDGRDVFKIVAEKYFVKGLGDFMKHRIEFVDGFVKESDIHEHSYMESLINEFGFQRHSVECGWLRNGYHGHVVEAVPKEDSTVWEKHGSVERRKGSSSSHEDTGSDRSSTTQGAESKGKGTSFNTRRDQKRGGHGRQERKGRQGRQRCSKDPRG